MLQVPSAILHALFCAVVFFHHSAAIDASQLGIKVNDGVARGSAKKIVLGSVAEIAGLSQWTDEQAVDLAFVAHEGMKAAYQAANVPLMYANMSITTGAPAVTSTLFINNTAYISSSMTGGTFLYNPNTTALGFASPSHPCSGAVQHALVKCQIKSVSFTGSRNVASCGEAMAALAFCSSNSLDEFSNATRIISIHEATGEPATVESCDNSYDKMMYQGEWGCHDFTSNTGIQLHVVPHDTFRAPTTVDSKDIHISYARYP